MSEQEIRAILKRVTERLARQIVMPAGRVALPLALGSGLAGATGCEPEPTSTPIYMAPDAFVEVDPGQDPGTDDFNPPDTLYMGPDAYDSYDPGPLPEYMAPDTGVTDEGPLPPYMAPDPGNPDPGDMPLYMAP